MNIQRPVITEKSLERASRGWYTFAVTKSAKKGAIAAEVEKMYHVNVTGVRTIAVHGKVRRTGRSMIRTKKPDWKKAVVQLKAGQKIDAFEVTTKEEPVQEAKKEAKK